MAQGINNFFPLHLNVYKIDYLSTILKTSPQIIQDIISNKNELVGKFEKLKKNGKSTRLIHYPFYEYKVLLKRLNKFLLQHSTFDKSVVGGITDKNLMDMVKMHCGKEAIYQVDLCNFFPNIDFERVQNLFFKSGCSDEIAYKLAKFTTYNDKLPQGFPTSTTVANLVAYKLDFDQSNICNKEKALRTRWVDDIIVSGRIMNLEKIVHKINTSIVKNGFALNKEKYKFHRRKNSCITIVGLDLNKHNPNIPAEVIANLEEFLIAIDTVGITRACEVFENQLTFKKRDLRKSIRGKINYIKQINPEKVQFLEELYETIDWNFNSDDNKEE